MSVLQQLKMYCSKALRYLGLGPATTVAEYLLWDPGTPVATRPVYDPGSDMFANPGTPRERPLIPGCGSGQSHDRHSQALATAPALSARSTPRWVYAASKSALRRCVVAYGSPFADKEFMSLVAGWCPGPDEVGLGLIMAVHGAEVVPTFGPDLGSHIERSDSFNFLASTFYYPESGVLFCNACRSLFKVTGVQSVSSVSALLGQRDDEAILDRLVRRVVSHSTGQHLSLFRSLGKKSAQLLFYLDHPGLIGVTVDGLRGFRPAEKDIPSVLRRLLLSLDRLEAKFGQKFGCTVQPRIGRLICWTDAASLRRLVPSSQEPLLGPGQCPFDRELNKILQGLSQAGRAYSECARFEARPVAYPRPAADEPSSSSSLSTVPPAPARSSVAVAAWAREVAPLFRPSKPQHPPRLPPPRRPPPRLPVVTAIGPASSAPPGTGTSTSSRHDTAAPVPVASSTSSSVSSFVAPADPGWTVPSSASSLSSQPVLVDLISTEEFASCPFPVLAVDGPEDGQVRNDERGSFVAVPRPDYGIVPSDDDDIQGWLIDPETFFSPTTSPRASDEASVSSFVVPSTEVSVTLTEGITDTRPVLAPSSTSTSFRADVSRYVTDTDMKASIRAAGLRVPPLTPADVFAPKVYATCDFLPHGQGQFRNVWWVEDYRLPMRDSDEAPRSAFATEITQYWNDLSALVGQSCVSMLRDTSTLVQHPRVAGLIDRKYWLHPEELRSEDTTNLGGRVLVACGTLISSECRKYGQHWCLSATDLLLWLHQAHLPVTAVTLHSRKGQILEGVLNEASLSFCCRRHCEESIPKLLHLTARRPFREGSNLFFTRSRRAWTLSERVCTVTGQSYRSGLNIQELTLTWLYWYLSKSGRSSLCNASELRMASYESTAVIHDWEWVSASTIFDAYHDSGIRQGSYTPLSWILGSSGQARDAAVGISQGLRLVNSEGSGPVLSTIPEETDAPASNEAS